MNWGDELPTFALYAAIAAAALGALATGPGRRVLAGLLTRIEAMPRGRFVVLLLGLTLAARLAFLPAFEPPFTTDVKEYVEKAALIADEGTPRSQELKPDGRPNYRTLGYSLALAGWYKATGTRGMTSARILNVVLAGGTALLLVALGNVLRQRLAGRVGALLFAVHVPLAIFAMTPYAETWAALLVTALTWVLARLWQGEGGRVANALLLGSIGGVLVISRTEFIWLPPLWAAALLVHGRREVARWVVPVAVSLAACVVPIVVNHEMRSGYPGELRTSTMGGRILYFGNNPHGVDGLANGTPPAVEAAERMYAQDATGGIARQAAVDWMTSHPGAVAFNGVKKLYHLWFASPIGFGWHTQTGLPGGLDPRAAGALRRIAWVQGLAWLFAGLLGLGLAYRGFSFPIWLLAAHAAFWCLFATYSRYRYPVEPLVLLAASAWLVHRATRTGQMQPRGDELRREEVRTNP